MSVETVRTVAQMFIELHLRRNSATAKVINNIVYRIFDAMSKDLHIEISEHFGIKSVENLVANRRNRFINRYGETDNYLCRMLS